MPSLTMSTNILLSLDLPHWRHDILCKFLQRESTCMKCRALFSGRNIIHLSSTEFFTVWLMLGMLGKNFSRQHFEIVFLFFPENRIWYLIFYANCLFRRQCMKCQILFSGEKIEKYHQFVSYCISQENGCCSRDKTNDVFFFWFCFVFCISTIHLCLFYKCSRELTKIFSYYFSEKKIKLHISFEMSA